MKQARPVNLNLLKIRFPVPAIVSILHRVSGIILFLLLPFLLWMLSESLGSEDSFQFLKECLSLMWVKVITWIILSALAYHLVAGIRHLIMDMGVGESLQAGRATSYVVLVISAVIVILLGVWLW